MAKADEAARRIRLEGAAELLEVAHVRYRALTGVLRGLLWRERLFKNADVAAAVAQSWDEVQSALGRALRLSQQEGWSARNGLGKLISEVSELSGELQGLVAKKVAGRGPLSFSEGLSMLVDEATPAPQGDALKWKLAREALPAALPEVEDVRVFTAFLEELFSRPLPVGDAYPWLPSEAAALEVQLPVGEAKVAELWRRVSRAPKGDRVERMLLSKARFAPLAPPSDGPQVLVAAEFWRKVAWQKVHTVLEEFVSPVTVADAEALRTFTFLAEAALNPAAALAPSPTLKPARAALIALSRSLWRGTLAASEQEWARRLELGKMVDAGPRDEDAQRLVDTLWMYSRVRWRNAGATKGVDPRRGLVAALEEARAWATANKRR